MPVGILDNLGHREIANWAAGFLIITTVHLNSMYKRSINK